MFGVSARQTSECRLVGPVALVDIPARGAFPRGVARIDSDNRNPGENRFVRDKRSELRESPTVQNCSLRFPNRYPTSDSGQFLDRNSSAGDFGCLNDLLANDVVGVRGESSLTPGKLFESAFGRSVLLSLKFGAKMSMSEPNAPYGRAAVAESIRSAGDLSNPKIDAKKGRRLGLCRFADFARGPEIEPTAAIDQVGLSMLAGEQRELWGTSSESNLQALVESTNRDGLLCGLPSENARIVSDRTVRAKGALGLLVELVRVRNLSNATYGDLRGQSEFTAKCQIAQRVDAVLSELLNLPRPLGHPVACLVDSLNRFQQRSVLRWSGEQLHFGGKPHSAPSSDVFGALDVTADCSGAYVASGAHVIGRGPESASPQLLFDLRKPSEQLTRRASLQDLYAITDRNRWRERYEQMDVIGLNLDSENRPVALSADRIQQFSESAGDAPGQNTLSILRTPHHVVGGLVDRIATVYDFHRYPHGSIESRLLSWLKPEVSGAEVSQ